MRRDFYGTLMRLGGNQITVTRRPIGTFVEGRYVKSTTTEQLFIEGSFQPLSPEELQFLPEGQRTDDARALYTTAVLIVGDSPDQLTFNNVIYEAVGTTDWDAAGSYFRYRVVKVGQK